MNRLAARYRKHRVDLRDDGEFVFVPERLPLFVEAVGGAGKRVLDMGCRTGAVTQHFLTGNGEPSLSFVGGRLVRFHRRLFANDLVFVVRLTPGSAREELLGDELEAFA